VEVRIGYVDQFWAEVGEVGRVFKLFNTSMGNNMRAGLLNFERWKKMWPFLASS
jgi:hypothetical protein